ncbi:hypothetical protein N7490_005244 [Penicillium lividum]|nr:hypothetical protein N7490_005244 [Penicillium lividum]
MEILVHVSAPSRAQDDARYRDQVAAILSGLTADIRQDSRHLGHTTPILDWVPEQPITTQIGSSQTAPLDPIQVRQPVQDSLGSLVSVIPDSQPDIYQVCQTSECLDLANPHKKPRLESPSHTSPSLSLREPIISPPISTPPHSNRHGFPIPNSNITTPSNSPLLSLPLEIRPPLPPISNATFNTHITPTLSMLTERLNPARTYKPLHQTRSLDPLERGYWAVHFNIWPENNVKHLENRPEPEPDPNLETNMKGSETHRNWSISFFTRFWSFLSDFVGKDARAGWGVWCILEHASPHASPSVADAALDLSTSVLLKVYAWGEVAMHVYLLLFLASERRVRGMEVQWRDSADQPVIQMP